MTEMFINQTIMAKNKGFIIIGILGTILAILGLSKLRPKTKSASSTEPDASGGGGGGGFLKSEEEPVITPPIETEEEPVITPPIETIGKIPIPTTKPLPIILTAKPLPIPAPKPLPKPIIKPILIKKPNKQLKFSGKETDDEFAIALERTL